MRPTRTVLVVDDSVLIRRVVQIALETDQRWRVHAAESGAEGIEIAARERPDVILLDVEMPHLDGPATLTRLRDREATRAIPVLFLTGHDGEDDRRELIALGVEGLITKPFVPDLLAAELDRLLGAPS
jgi:CheY-like chemotaxis protein